MTARQRSRNWFAACVELDPIQQAGFDAAKFGNEDDRSFKLGADTASTATMGCVIGCLRSDIAVQFRVDILWGPMATEALGAATGKAFVREFLSGAFASGMGLRNPDAAAAMRYRSTLESQDKAMSFSTPAEFADSLNRCSFADRALSAVLSSIPNGVLSSGLGTGEVATMETLEYANPALGWTLVPTYACVGHETVAEVLDVVDGCMVGPALTVDGDAWNAVDPDGARDFMDRARTTWSR